MDEWAALAKPKLKPKTLVQDYATWYDENGMQHNDPIGKMYEI